jgi:hypothetical protein
MTDEQREEIVRFIGESMIANLQRNVLTYQEVTALVQAAVRDKLHDMFTPPLEVRDGDRSLL